MRRPAPLPSRPEQEPPAARPVRRLPSVPVPRRADPDENATEPIEPLEAADLDPAPVEPDAADDLTQRDLWRAARARRRALKSEIRRFTQRSRRRRTLWLGIIGAFVLLVGGSVAAAYSPLFAVQQITVIGADRLEPETVEAALSDQIGTPLALVDSSEVKAALVGFPLIETYTLEARPPHELAVRIVERTPVGVLDTDAGYALVDAAGVVLSTSDARPEGQPVLDIAGGPGSEAFVEAGLVVRSLPADLRSRLAHVTADTRDDVTLTFSRVTAVWGSAEDSAEKVRILQLLIAQHPDSSHFDVSAPNAVVVG